MKEERLLFALVSFSFSVRFSLSFRLSFWLASSCTLCSSRSKAEMPNLEEVEAEMEAEESCSFAFASAAPVLSWKLARWCTGAQVWPQSIRASSQFRVWSKSLPARQALGATVFGLCVGPICSLWASRKLSHSAQTAGKQWPTNWPTSRPNWCWAAAANLCPLLIGFLFNLSFDCLRNRANLWEQTTWTA